MDILTESGLSRFLTYDNEQDCAFISAFRVARDCGKGKRYTKRENLQRGSNLLAKLMTKGYGVASVLGRFRERGQDTSEKTFFAVNLNDDEDFVEHIIELGKHFEQDAVMFLPVGAFHGNSGAYYYRTNQCEDNFMRQMGWGIKHFLGPVRFGREVSDFLIRISHKNFYFDEGVKLIREDMPTESVFTRGMVAWEASKDWEDTDNIFFLPFSSSKVSGNKRRLFILESDGVPDYIDGDDFDDFLESVIDEGFGGEDALYGLTGIEVENSRFGVDEDGNYWMWLPIHLNQKNKEGSVMGKKRVVRQERDIAKERYAVPLVPVYPFIIEEWLRDEHDRELFLDSAYEDGDSDMERKKEIVRRSREHYDHPVPNPEFFGY